jgi:hypothetical protein
MAGSSPAMTEGERPASAFVTPEEAGVQIEGLSWQSP